MRLPGDTAAFVVDLKHYHGLCELNYCLFTRLLPDVRTGSHWAFELPAHSRQPTTTATPSIPVFFDKHDESAYTSCLFIWQAPTADILNGYIKTPKITARLYHDAKMAEVVAWDNHRHWQGVYSYPNRKMYHRDERMALNRFLGEWLAHCGRCAVPTSDPVKSIPL